MLKHRVGWPLGTQMFMTIAVRIVKIQERSNQATGSPKNKAVAIRRL